MGRGPKCRWIPLNTTLTFPQIEYINVKTYKESIAPSELSQKILN